MTVDVARFRGRSSVLLVVALMVFVTAIQAETNSFLVIEPPAKILIDENPDFESTWDKKKFDHSLLDAIVSKYINEKGLVDYAGIQSEISKLNEYCFRLSQTPPEGLANEKERYAFYVNAYNAFTLKGVLTILPKEKSQWGRFSLIACKPSMWDHTKFSINGNMLSLNDIEHGILRKEFKDPRVHAAVNCASMGCPKLLNEAFVPEKLDEQLDKVARSWVNDPDRNRLEGSTLLISKIFDWYGKDFKGGPIPFFVKYTTDEEKRKKIESLTDENIQYLDYSWALNKQ